MTKKKLIALAEKHGYTFYEKSLGMYKLVNKKGHEIRSPTIAGLARCFEKWGEK